MVDYAVIDSRGLRRRAAGGHVVAVDTAGRDLEVPQDVVTPSLLVADVSEAVKRVEGDKVTEDLDRGQLWLVRGLAVDRLVMESVSEGTLTMAELIREVEAAGHVWGTTLL
jgi:hypothetical protein